MIRLFEEEGDSKKLRLMYVDFQVMLNPFDEDDKSILDTIWAMIDRRDKENGADLSLELSEKISLLLKHDWQRAKREAKPKRMCFLKCKMSSNDNRVSYDKFEKKRHSNEKD